MQARRDKTMFSKHLNQRPSIARPEMTTSPPALPSNHLNSHNRANGQQMTPKAKKFLLKSLFVVLFFAATIKLFGAMNLFALILTAAFTFLFVWTNYFVVSKSLSPEFQKWKKTKTNKDNQKYKTST